MGVLISRPYLVADVILKSAAAAQANPEEKEPETPETLQHVMRGTDESEG